MRSRFALLLVALLLPLAGVRAQPSWGGGSFSFQLRDRDGAPVTRARKDVVMRPVWSGMDASRTATTFASEVEWNGGDVVEYRTARGVGAGLMPPDFRLLVVQGRDTMTIIPPDFSRERVQLGAVRFRPGVYRVPDWFPVLRAAVLCVGVRIEPLDWTRFRVDRYEALPRFTPRFLRAIVQKDRVVRLGAAVTQRGRYAQTLWLGGGRGVRYIADEEYVRSRALPFERTSDSGAHWESLFRCSEMINPEIVAVGGDVLIWWNHNGLPAILRSSDGGTTWQAMTLDMVMPLSREQPFAPFGFQSLRVEAGRVIVVGEQVLWVNGSYHTVPGEYELLFDLDHKGEAWREIEGWTAERLRELIEEG